MRFYKQPHAFYCGVDLHARTMYLCILDHAGNIVLHKEVPCEPAAASTYRTRLMEKLNLHNTAEIIRFALENDIVG